MFIHPFAAMALVTLSLIASAQEIQKKAHPADADAASTRFTYQSAFKSYRPASDPPETPDRIWRAANEDMGKLGGHMGHIKDEPPAGKHRCRTTSMTEGRIK